jgi:glycosyltransferase involved in cell wall biosynthesis
MQTILVLDVAAGEGGALSVLNEYYDRFRRDTENRYVFCVGLPELAESDTVRVRRFPWVKRSWLHRLWFEHVTVRRLLRREGIDRIFSLQNTAVSGTKLPQTVYLHQPLPFCGIRFSLRKQPKFWVYQHLIARRIYASLRRAEQVIVQTEWMKRAACERAGISPEKVVLETPQISCVVTEKFRPQEWKRTFFYPASNYSYKNHELILQAVEQLVKEGVTDFTVRFTLKAEELPIMAKYPLAAERVELCGSIPREAVMAAYASSVLLFPSYIETFGLPLLEAKMTGAPILASDCPFSHEILDAYEDVRFFDPFDAASLAACMREKLEDKS